MLLTVELIFGVSLKNGGNMALDTWINLVSNGLNTAGSVYGSATAAKVAQSNQQTASINASAMVTVAKYAVVIVVIIVAFKYLFKKRRKR